MEESLCDFNEGAAKDMESSYLKRQEQEDVHVEGRNNSLSLDKHVLMFPPTSEPICTLGASEHFKVGRFHEMDPSKLSADSPEQLKSVRIVMVSDKGKHQVSLRYPSIQSLRMYFGDPNFGKPEGKKIPVLDEKCVMGLEFALKALHRRVPTEEFSQKRNSWSFWVAPSEENENENETDEATKLVSKQGLCWSQLKFTGMMQWGKRLQVRFLGRHEEQKVESSEIFEESRVTVEHKEQSEGTEKKKKGSEERERMKELVSCGLRMTRQCKRKSQNESNSWFEKSKKAKIATKKQQLVVYSKNKQKISIDRWSIERYKLAEENMLKVMKAKGAVHGNPILRPELRLEARKYIGDTGLLDHLLKHMAGKVAPGGTERFRRRHNAEGAMEYWLEDADLVDIRREAGVQDPYWTPPPGWKLGDNLSQEPITSRELREIKEELFKLKEDMQELLASKTREEALAIVTTPGSCLSSLNLGNDGSLVPKQEIYAELVSKKAKVEEQLKEISLILSGMEEQLGILKRRAEKPTMLESLMPPSLFPGPTPMAPGVGGEKRKEKKDNNNKATKSANIQMQERRIAGDKAARRERLKSSFQICKPQGTFIWPNMGVSPQGVVQFDDLTHIPTPSSASSSTTLAAKLVPKPQTQHPSSPVKPVAERRPVSSATLTHVTAPFFTQLSPPLGAPGSKITTTNTKNASSINLNEAPLTID